MPLKLSSVLCGLSLDRESGDGFKSLLGLTCWVILGVTVLNSEMGRSKGVCNLYLKVQMGAAGISKNYSGLLIEIGRSSVLDLFDAYWKVPLCTQKVILLFYFQRNLYGRIGGLLEHKEPVHVRFPGPRSRLTKSDSSRVDPRNLHSNMPPR